MANLFEKIKMKRPVYNSSGTKEIPKDLWVKCSNCASSIFKKTFMENLRVCDKCNYHHKMTALERIKYITDEGTFKEINKGLLSSDPLGFGDEYLKKLKADQVKSNLDDAILTGEAKINNIDVLIGVMDFGYRGGSMGSVVGEKIVRLFEKAAEKKIPVLIFSASGGARMQEGMLSLMQMTRTSAAFNKLDENGVLYICIMTDPTTAGVAASFASLADIILAEPKAIIGFSGARVIEQTIRQKLPPGFQTSEFYLEKGFIDSVVPRKELKKTLIKLLEFNLN